MEKKRSLLTVVVLLVGALALFLGLKRGEMDVYWMKSIQICLECVGIG